MSARPVDRISLLGQQPSIRASDVASAVASLEAIPLFNHIEDKTALVNQTIDAGLTNLDVASRSNTLRVDSRIRDLADDQSRDQG